MSILIWFIGHRVIFQIACRHALAARAFACDIFIALEASLCLSMYWSHVQSRLHAFLEQQSLVLRAAEAAFAQSGWTGLGCASDIA